MSLNLFVKGFERPDLTWAFGAPRDTTPADRTAGTAPRYPSPPGKVDLIMDLQADKKVSFELAPVDEVGNPTEFDGTIVYSVDDPSILALTDNGDGTGVVAAVGPTGETTLRGVASPAGGGASVDGATLVRVVPGDAETFEFAFGEPEEVTPDDVEPTPEPA